jgi:hypothetical protein
MTMGWFTLTTVYAKSLIDLGDSWRYTMPYVSDQCSPVTGMWQVTVVLVHLGILRLTDVRGRNQSRYERFLNH